MDCLLCSVDFGIACGRLVCDGYTGQRAFGVGRELE